MEKRGRTDRAARNQVHQSNRKEQLLFYGITAPQNRQNAYRATTAITPLSIGPETVDLPVAFIADNPFPSRNNHEINPLCRGIIGDALSPIIAHHSPRDNRNNCNNPSPPAAAPIPPSPLQKTPHCILSRILACHNSPTRYFPRPQTICQGSSGVEQGTHKPLVGSSTLPPGTTFI